MVDIVDNKDRGKDCHGGECKTLHEDELQTKINDAIMVLMPSIEKEFYYFRDNNICIGDYLTFLMGIVCKTSIMYLENCNNAQPQVNFDQHLMTLIKGLCMFHGVNVQDHRMTRETSSLH